jgi:hypothetical protein
MKWAYKIQKIDLFNKDAGKESLEKMNKAGQEEWEFVAISGGIIFYKRPVGGIDEQRRLAEKQQMAEKGLRIS